MKNVSGKTALITGGARGMGRLWAEHFLSDGARVILWDRDQSELSKTRDELQNHFQTQIRTNEIDITDRKAVYRVAGEILKEGTVDILVNNAGIVTGGDFLTIPDEKLEAILDVNLKALLWTMKAFLPSMIERNEGHIVNISSASGLVGVPYMVSYTASKWGVIGLTESVKLELEDKGIRGVRMTLLCPSYIDTGMFGGVKSPLLLPIMKPERFVKKAYRAFKRNRYLVLAPFFMNIVPFIKGILPNGLLNWVSKMMGVTASMKTWKGR